MTVKEILSQLTLEEKAGLCSGEDFWHLKSIQRLGLPGVMVCDGPHGLRKQASEADHLGLKLSVPAVCFPAASATACSFDTGLLKEMGAALGQMCQAEDVSVLLGPAVNIKRSPLCGRNFEYFSEDPCLAGEMAAAHIRGVQSQNVGTSLKHFAANNQEYRRMTSSSQVDERTLREIYFPAFERAVKKAQPWTVMCSYNRINGEFASENKWLLTDVLRDEWGFEGYVMTDWGACNDRVKGLKAGLELEMPASGGVNDREIVRAVREGRLDEAVLDRAVERILNITLRYLQNHKPTVCDLDAQNQLARKVARESMVLLKNQGALPIAKEQKVAFIGAFAKTPRYQGGGSSHINATKVTGALEAAQGRFNVTYAPGYSLERETPDPALIEEAVSAAKAADVAVVFAGLPDAFESEGYDRAHMRMPQSHNALIEAVAAAQPNTVVVLYNGSPVETPWIDQVNALLEGYLGGQAVGAATVDLLFGDYSPCGKLAETFPLRLEDNPSYLNFPGVKDTVEYREGVFVGYRYYDSKKMPVRFPFGFGLSYTQFAYSNLCLSADALGPDDTLTCRLKVKNTGSRPGKEIVQLYVRDCTGAALRPDKELRGFAKVALQPGEEKEVALTLDMRAFAFYDVESHAWRAADGTFEILVGASSRDIRLSGAVTFQNPVKNPVQVHENWTVGDLLADPRTGPAAKKLLGQMMPDLDLEDEKAKEDMMLHVMLNLPLRSVRSFVGADFDNDRLRGLIDEMNAALKG